MQLYVCCDALSASDREQMSDKYTLKHHNLQSRELLSQNGKCFVNKRQNMLHVFSLGKKIAWIYPIGKHRTRCLQKDFHFVSEYCQTTSTRDVGLSNCIMDDIKMVCVQQDFPSKPLP